MNTEAEGESGMEQKKRRDSETGQLVREGSGQEEHDAVKDATLKDVRRRFSSFFFRLGGVGTSMLVYQHYFRKFLNQSCP